MSLETRMTLSEEVISALQDLIQLNIDSRDGFRNAAEHVKEQALAELFRDVAGDRNDQVSELRTLVASSNHEPESSGSATAAMHRAWMDLRSAIGGGDAAILAEAERGEDHIKEKYEEALKKCGGCIAQDVLTRHYAAVKTVHDRIRDLRDEYNETE